MLHMQENGVVSYKLCVHNSFLERPQEFLTGLKCTDGLGTAESMNAYICEHKDSLARILRSRELRNPRKAKKKGWKTCNECESEKPKDEVH